MGSTNHSETDQKQTDAQRLAEIEERLAVVSNLSPMQHRFLIRYVFHGNATRAAEEAGYKHPNKQGPRLARNPKILNAIAIFFYRDQMSAEEVIARLSQQARAEYADYLRTTEGGSGYVDLKRLLADGKGHLVKTIRNSQYGQTIEFYDAHQALVDIGRYHRLFKDVSLSMDLSQVSDEQLDELINSL